MSKAPAFQLYAADFYMDTVGWAAEEVGLYVRLLMAEWVNGPLPNNISHLSRIAGCEEEDFKKWWDKPRLKFYEDSDGNLFNKRLEKTRKEQKKFIKLQKKKGIASWEVRKDKGEMTREGYKPEAKPEAKPKPNSSSSTSSSSLKEVKEASLIVDNLKEAPSEKEPDALMSDLREITEDIGRRMPDVRKQRQMMMFIESNVARKNHAAMMHCLKSLQKQLQNGTDIQAPKQYLEAALKIEDGKHNAQEYEERAKSFKGPPTRGGMMAIGKVFEMAAKEG